MAEVDDEVQTEEDTSSGGGLKLILAGVGAAAVLGGGAAAWFTGVIPGLLGMDAEATEVADTDGEPNTKKGKKAEDVVVTSIVKLEPIIISLPAPNQIRRKLPRLNVAIALEVTDVEYTEERRPQLRNDLISTIRLIDAQTLNSPDGLDVLRSTIQDSAGAVLGTTLQQVLITEFILL